MKNILFLLAVFITLVIPNMTTAQALRGVEPRPVEIEDSKPTSAQQLAKALTLSSSLVFHTQAKVFVCRIRSSNDLQRDLDDWLKSEGAKVELAYVTQSQGVVGTETFVVLTVFYRFRK